MIKIIKEGHEPEPIVYYKKCRNCGCEFTFNESDCHYDTDWNKFIACPHCRVTSSRGLNKKYKEKKHGRTN